MGRPLAENIDLYFSTALHSFHDISGCPLSSPRHAYGPIDKRASGDAMLPRYPAEKSGLW